MPCCLLDTGKKEFCIAVPGRVNLIGEHIDYHNLPVLPMAIQKQISLHCRTLAKLTVEAESPSFGHCEISLSDPLACTGNGNWSNYIKAAIEAVKARWDIAQGLSAMVNSDLPAAAGLSSSSALLTAFSIALLHANGITPQLNELMEILPNGEQFVGTRGGGMDHAAVLASRAGCALLVEFAPFRFSTVPIPDTWCFLIAHSMSTAEKSGSVRQQYNARRTAGVDALAKLGFASYRAAIEQHSLPQLLALSQNAALADSAKRAFRHVVSESFRVHQAVAALRSHDKIAFGRLLCASHASLRDDLRVSSPDLDRFVDDAMNAGAIGARLTGAGFGGCAIVFSEREQRERIAETLVRKFYGNRTDFDPARHLIFAEASNGALGV